ncbi:GAF domain protein [Thalassoporum mexicanum PCC 7367]|uniref:sensor histidine kinase n=1 Tax=Thalassoporum mexicanum TaxID=3457544 RepID=UPI00029FD54B|nr:GAF domain-containing protein [Pseudanabaena sp. PCC 7367]AFY70662.1 GAF domain protein [Pseudanabaena sp. PCC 7367]
MSQARSNPADRQFVNLGRVMQVLREEENVDNLIASTIDYLRDNFDYKLVWVGLYDRANHRLVGKGGSTPAGEIKFLKERFALEPGDCLDQVILQRKPLGIPDLRQESRSGDWRKVARKFEIQGTLFWPIYHNETAFGVAILGSHLWNISPRPDEKARFSMLFGGLAASLQRIETDWQTQQTKRPDQPLLGLLDGLRNLQSLAERIDAVVEVTHSFVMPNRTSVYWFEREHRYFWRRAVNRQRKMVSARNDNTAGITVQNAPTMYQALSKDELVVVVDAQSMTKGDISSCVLEQFGCIGMIAAPIVFQGELVGFLCVESDEPRLWTEDERGFTKGVAQLLAMAAPLEEMEAAVERIASDQMLTAGIARAIYSDHDWEDSLDHAANQLCQRLNAERFWIVVYNRDTECFDVHFQYHPKNRRPLPMHFTELADVDRQMMEQASETVMVENVESDFKFMTWRSSLLELEVRSMMISSTAIGKPLEGLLAVGHESPRTWSRPERELVQAVAQQVGLISHQANLQKQADERQKLHQATQFGLVSLQQANTIEKLNPMVVQLMSQIMQAPLAVLVTWIPGRIGGQIAATFGSADQFKLRVKDAVLAVESDPLVQWTTQTEGILPLSVHDLPAETLDWLNAPGIGQILTMVLRTTPDHQPTGMILVADKPGRRWLDRHLQAFNILTNQLAWTRRHIVLVEKLHQNRNELERLNWYKHRRIEDMYRSVGGGVQRLIQLDAGSGNSVGSMRMQQSLKQLQASMSSLPQIIRKEQWRLRPTYETAPLAGLIKRSLERVDALVKQRQLWSQVHNQANAIVGGDIAKIEMILNELLLFACGRSEVGGRIDMWCRQLDESSLELAITDSGEIDQQLLDALRDGHSGDLLTSTILDQPPGLHLAICQSLMQEAGGELSLYKLEDNRILSRLILPLSSN